MNKGKWCKCHYCGIEYIRLDNERFTADDENKCCDDCYKDILKD